jgi:hypothetical protein
LFHFLLERNVTCTAGIEHDIKVWAPTAQQPQAPSPISLRAAMAANQRERDAARDAMSEPEQWLLQLLAAQRRRWVILIVAYGIHLQSYFQCSI